MYASVTSGTVQPGKMSEFLTTYHEEIVPGIPELSIKHHYLLTDAETNKVIAISVYETKAEAKDLQESGEFGKLLSLLADSIAADSITRELYEISVQV